MTRQELNSREVAKARESLKRIGNHVTDKCGYFYSYLERLIDAIVKAIAGNPNADISIYIDSFKSTLNRLVEENMEYSYMEGVAREEKDKKDYGWILPILLLDKDYKKATSMYTNAFRREIDFFIENGGNIFELGIYLKDPLSYSSVHKWDINKFKDSVNGIRRGMSYTIMKVIAPILLNTGMFAHNRTLQEIWKDNGIKYYQGFRNSDYYCPLCDELCSEPHPIDDMVFPAHPRCVCGIVYLNDYDG